VTTAAAIAGSRVQPQPSIGPVILRTDYVYLYFVLFTASGAVFRYGPINTYLWYAIYVWTAARLCLSLPTLVQAMSRNWAVFLWPALALASVVWSLAPAASLRGGLQLLMTTIIAVFIGTRFSLREILIGSVVVLSAALLASLALLLAGASDLFAYAGGFQGIFAHKNTFGLRMNILFAIALVLFFCTRWKLMLAVLMALSLFGLVLSKSATSQILALLTPGILLAMSVLKLQARQASLAAAAAIIVSAGAAGALFVANSDPIAYVLEGFDKDSTLTGRTFLWERSFAEIGEHPLLGGGYQAFWANDRSSDVLWIRNLTLDTVKGFHNVGLEVWNDLGIPGLLALNGVLLWYVVRTWRYFIASPSALATFPFFFTIVVIVSASMNNSFFRQHELVHVMICAFFAAAAFRWQRRPRFHSNRRLAAHV
jgi:O-antigen ligase